MYFFSMDTMCILCIVHVYTLQYMDKIAHFYGYTIQPVELGRGEGGGNGRERSPGIKATITNNSLIVNPSVFILFVVFT